MAKSSSRLEIIIDSRTAKQNADQLRVSLDAITAAGTKAATSAGKFGTAANAAAAEIARFNAAATTGSGSNNRFGSSAAAAAAEVARLNASTTAGAGSNTRFGAAAAAAAASVTVLNAQSAASTATIIRLGAASDAATAAIARLDRANGSAIISSRGLTASSAALGVTLTGAVVALAAKEILSLTDRYKALQGQLALVSSSNAEAAQTFETLRSMANTTGSSLESTVKLYTRFSNATRGAGFSQDQLLKATDAVNKAFLVSSATTAEAAAASTQLSQAMASGTLRGEELNSVMEQAPRITRALSEYLGVTNGQIRAMAAEGKITSEIVMNSLLKSLSSLNKEVAIMPLRFEQASQALKNNFLAVIGQVNVDPVIDSVKTLADTLADPKASEGIKSISNGLASIASVGANGLNGVLSNIDALIALAGAYATGVGVKLAGTFILSANARISDATASLRQVDAAKLAMAAEVQASQVTMRRVVAEQQMTGAKLARANAELLATRGTNAETFALEAQIAAASANRVATLALTEAKAAHTIVENNLTAAITRGAAVRSATMAAVGGPLGAITLAATVAAGAYLYFSGSTDKSTQSLIENNASLDDSIAKYKELNAEQKRSQVIEWADKQKEAMATSSAALNDYQRDANATFFSLTNGSTDYQAAFGKMIDEVRGGKRTLDSVTQWAKDTYGLSGAQVNGLANTATAYSVSAERAVDYGEKLVSVNAVSQVAIQSADALKFAQRESAKAAGASAATWDKYIEGLTKTRDLVGANVVAEAAYNAIKLGAGPAQQEQARAIASQTLLLNKLEQAVKENNKAEQERLRVLLVASYAAQQAAEDTAAIKKKADDDAANSAEASAKRQREALQSVVNAGLRKSFPSLFQDQQDVQGYPLITNGKVAPVEKAAPRKTPQQLADGQFNQVIEGTTPNKAPKAKSTQGAMSAAMSTFDALHKKAEPAADAVRTLVKAQEQLQLVLSKGDITQQQYGVALAQASRDYAAVIAKTGELTQAEQYRLQIQKQLQNQQDTANQAAVAVGMGDKEASRQDERLKLEKDTNDRILDLKSKLGSAETDQARKSLEDQIKATEEMQPKQLAILEQGWVQVDAAQANWMNGITAGWDNYQAKVQDVASQTESIMTGSLDTITSGFGGAFSAMALDGQSFGEVTRSTFESLTRGVLDGLGQMAAQWLVNQGIQLVFGKTAEVLATEEMARIAAKTAAETTSAATVATAKVAADGIAQGSALASIATTLAANVSAAATTLASWLPAALVASVGSFGAAAIVGGTALVAAYALLKGFSGGGYTGAGGVNDPAGIVHKGEVVWSQEDIRKFGGVASVEALRKGEALPAGMSRSSPKQGSAPASGQVAFKQNVEIHNYANARVTTRQDEDGRLKVMIRAVEEHLVDGMMRGSGPMVEATAYAFNLKKGSY